MCNEFLICTLRAFKKATDSQLGQGWPDLVLIVGHEALKLITQVGGLGDQAV
ncbi:MAG: hypothetical protein R2709_02235 [Marmoricola sp.]